MAQAKAAVSAAKAKLEIAKLEARKCVLFDEGPGFYLGV